MSCANTRKVTLTKSRRRSFPFVNFKLRNNRRYVFKFLCWQTYFEGHLVRSNDNWSLFWWEFLIMVSHARVFLLLSFPSPTKKRKMSISNNWITSLRGQICMLAQWSMRLELIAASSTGRPVSSVGRASDYLAGGLGFEPQTGPTLRVLK